MSEKHVKFIEDMELAGLPIKCDYQGRNFYHGPAVVVENVQYALSKTSVPCTWDNMGHDWIVYPK